MNESNKYDCPVVDLSRPVIIKFGFRLITAGSTGTSTSLVVQRLCVHVELVEVRTKTNLVSNYKY